MCTVTFIPFGDSVLITSNRDEATVRLPAALPEAYDFPGGKILFPKDGQAGGTWIALHNNGNAMVLLNGAFKKHHHQPPYRKSRGLIFLDIFDGSEPHSAFQDIDLAGIEPFTLVIWEQQSLWEARWDGTEKYLIPLPADVPRIWSSVTLYDNEVIARRRSWFNQWLRDNPYRSADKIRQFHEFGGDGDPTNSFKMNRSGMLQTVSITGIEILQHKAIMNYKDILGGLVSVNEWYITDLMKHL